MPFEWHVRVGPEGPRGSGCVSSIPVSCRLGSRIVPAAASAGRLVCGSCQDERSQEVTQPAPLRASPRRFSCRAEGRGRRAALGVPRSNVRLTWQLLKQHEPERWARNTLLDSSSSTLAGHLGAGTSHPWLPTVLPEIRDF